jgi:hypothetical protein
VYNYCDKIGVGDKIMAFNMQGQKKAAEDKEQQ